MMFSSIKPKKFGKKLIIKWILLLIVVLSALFFLFLRFNLKNDNKDNLVSQNLVLGKDTLGPSMHLIIPKINVEADIEKVGTASNGEMETPSNTTNVGLFDLGPLPGENGSAVIAGHVDGKNGEAAVFKNLHKLKMGDELYVKNEKGTLIKFIVRESRIYNPGLVKEVFSSYSDSAHLNLVTCSGVWDEAKKSYSKRLVVFADIAP